MATVLWDRSYPRALDGAGEKKKGGTSKIYALFFVETKKHRSQSNLNLIDWDKTQTVLKGSTKKLFWVCQDLLRLEGMYESVWRVPHSLSQKKQKEGTVCGVYSTHVFGRRERVLSLVCLRAGIFLGEWVSSRVRVFGLWVVRVVDPTFNNNTNTTRCFSRECERARKCRMGL